MLTSKNADMETKGILCPTNSGGFWRRRYFLKGLKTGDNRGRQDGIGRQFILFFSRRKHFSPADAHPLSNISILVYTIITCFIGLLANLCATRTPPPNSLGIEVASSPCQRFYLSAFNRCRFSLREARVFKK